MREPTIDPAHLDRWAAILVDHSLGGLGPEDQVMIKGERISWPLMEAVERRVIRAGARPDVYLVPPNNDRGRIWSSAMVREGTPEQIQAVPDWNQVRYEAATKFVEVIASEDPAAYGGLTREQSGALMRVDFPYALMRWRSPWVITHYPTPGAAEAEGMDLDEYAELVVRTSIADPTRSRPAQERIAPLMEQARLLTMETTDPADDRLLELRMDISPSRPELCYGQTNIPDGELATSPDARSPEGEVYLDLPGLYAGRELGGVYLKLEEGRVVEHRADIGQAHLETILETDPGARRLGEVALGMNADIPRTLLDPLFLEKLGGTVHLALGDSYDDCFVDRPTSPEGRARVRELEEAGVINRSAQHVDLVADFRPGGCGRRVLLDETELVVRDGIWTLAG